MTSEEHKAVVQELWQLLYERDFEGVGSLFGPDGRYTDVFTPDDDVAVGPEQIAARLRLGLEPLERIEHHPGVVVAEGKVVMTEHREEWTWPTGENITIAFVSVHEFDDRGKIVRWWDYPDLQALLAAAPPWWIEHIMQGYEGGPTPDTSYVDGA